MDNKVIGTTSFILVVTVAVCIALLTAFSDGIRKLEWLDLESAAMACFGLAILGAVLGWCSFKNTLGKVSAILGTIMVIGFFTQLMNGSAPAPLPDPAEVSANDL